MATAPSVDHGGDGTCSSTWLNRSLHFLLRRLLPPASEHSLPGDAASVDVVVHHVKPHTQESAVTQEPYQQTPYEAVSATGASAAAPTGASSSVEEAPAPDPTQAFARAAPPVCAPASAPSTSPASKPASSSASASASCAPACAPAASSASCSPVLAPAALVAATPTPTAAPVYTSRNYVIGGLNFECLTRYKIKTIVGKGAYGLVCAAEDTRPRHPPVAVEDASAPTLPKTMVAVKKVIDPFNDHTDCKRLLREIRLLRSLRHPNVLHLTDVMPPASLSPSSWRDVYFVTRLYDTNLHRVIYSGHALTDAHVQYILWQVFRALRYLHGAGVVHRDMKPTNLLLNRDCELALADFGLARYMPHTTAAGCRMSTDASAVEKSPEREPRSRGGQLTKYVVTRWYRAPELLVQNKQYDAKVDMWSVGCILAEVLGAKAIFPGKDSLHQLRLVVEQLGMPSADELAIIQNEQAVSYITNLKPKVPAASSTAAAVERFAKLFPEADPQLLDLLARLLQFDPRKRPSAAEALAHPYLAAYREAPEEGLPTPEIEMGFERYSLSKEELRSLIWGEVVRYHPTLAPASASPASASPSSAFLSSASRQ
mmetsp:Transcript_67458/g.133735  ORF Transcript_67458/g.133735 Transcript_67458/m.133735 type:complete len:599 (-) Transcript_67458:750-2546(-)